MIPAGRSSSLDFFTTKLFAPHLSHLTSTHISYPARFYSSSAPGRNLYDVLGVEKTATPTQIKQAFYSKSKLFHPDNSNDDSTAAFVELKKAYDILRRPADRLSYDNRCKRTHHNIYDPHGYESRSTHFYDQSEDWKQFWRDHRSENVKDSSHQKRADAFWKSMIRWTGVVFTLVIIYSVGHIVQLRHRERAIAALVDEHEIAKSFLRQSEFKAKEVDKVELESLGRLLKADIDEAWKRRSEDFANRNKDEIREEYRWFRAVQGTDHTRQIKARRSERKEMS